LPREQPRGLIGGQLIPPSLSPRISSIARSAVAAGVGIVTLALLPLAIAILALTAVALISLLTPPLLIPLGGKLIATPFLLLRRLVRRGGCPHERRNKMGNIVITEFVSLDGVIEDPGGVEGFKLGARVFVINRGEDGDKFKLAETLVTEALLLGRKTLRCTTSRRSNGEASICSGGGSSDG